MRPLFIAFSMTTALLTGCAVATPAGSPAPGGVQSPGQPQQAPTQVTATVAPTELPILATRTTADRNTRLEVAIREVRAGTSAMTVTFSVTNRSVAGSDWMVWGFFDDGIRQTSDDAGWTVDGVAVIDVNNAKRYLPARTADHQCMCSQHLAGTAIGTDQTVFLSAVYQAVPSDVTTVSVDVPHAGTFGNIPVTR